MPIVDFQYDNNQSIVSKICIIVSCFLLLLFICLFFCCCCFVVVVVFHFSFLRVDKVLTSYAASLINCFALGVHMAGTVTTHWISSALNFSSPVSSEMSLIVSSFMNLMEWAKTVLALTCFPLAASMVVSKVRV